MRRIAVLLPILCLALAAPASAQDDVRPPLRAALAACGTGPTADERFAVFTGSMPALAGTHRMAMRFVLQVRDRGGRTWFRVRSRGFGRWQRSDPGKGGFVYTKRVERLDQDAVYRAVVRFRWYGRDAVQRTRVRRSRPCRQPEQRPNLRVEDLTFQEGSDPSERRYVVSIVNTGRTAAGPFEVGVTGIDRDLVRTVAGLPAGERATVELTGPRCRAAQEVLVTLDVRDVVDEAGERDNRLGRPCGGR